MRALTAQPANSKVCLNNLSQQKTVLLTGFSEPILGKKTDKKRTYLDRGDNFCALKKDNEKQSPLRATSYPSELTSLAKEVHLLKYRDESTAGNTGIETSQRCSTSSFDECDIVAQSEFSLKRQK